MNRYAKWIIPVLWLCSCSVDETTGYDAADDEHYMIFGVERVAQSRLDYDGQSATFEAGENIGLYAFYNNYYFYYNDYDVFAESVIFANQGLAVYDGYATSDPQLSWTFSTLYGTAPHTIDIVSYYPFKEYYNPDYVILIDYVDDDSIGPTLEFYYYNYDDDEQTYTTNSTVDFMTAYTRYSYYDEDEDDYGAATFRTEMLARESIPLTFTRQLASLNLQVTKPDGYETEIKVDSITVHFDAYQKYTLNTGNSDDPVAGWESDTMTSNYALTATTTLAEPKSLTETSWDSDPGEGVTYVVEDLLEDDELLFFPPDTDIFKIIFYITDDGEAKTYTWHPHITTIEANTRYTLSLELDPARAN
ncbi:MAG: hypothetical protein SNG35_01220 [Rikenellaceae bacterium]